MENLLLEKEASKALNLLIFTPTAYLAAEKKTHTTPPYSPPCLSGAIPADFGVSFSKSLQLQ